VKYRNLGSTDLVISEIGLGGHEYRRRAFVQHSRFTELDPNRKEVVRTALEMGVNYFDTTYAEEAQSIGTMLQALHVPRDRVYVNGMSVDMFRHLGERPAADWPAFIEAEVTERLELLHSDYIDLFCICSLEKDITPQRLDGALETLNRLKECGMLRHIGASCHNPALLARVIAERNPFAMVMTPINYHKHPPEALLQAVRQHGVGLVAIKPFVWVHYGLAFMLACRRAVAGRAIQGATLPQMALRWVLQYPEGSTVVPAANALSELVENTAAGDMDASVMDDDLLRACRDYPGTTEEMIGLIDHPFQDYRDFSLQAVRDVLGADYGQDKARYLAAWRSKH
jgi:aryl-alcohol dehydrogenase-like predicted oxidoreductase